MTAYLIFIREGAIVDQAAMDRYRGSNRTTPPLPRPAPLVVYGSIEALEGEAPDGVVVLQFASVEDAKAWYQSPAYQRAIPHRQQAADYRVFIVTGS
ncbi:DUF1330 domain-containing protein [Hydrocarboniphaga sp.]|uniref:DUF1330 domain-containing protein n=1 Tax=Hydrocarboniphaga sp. TaxID=2033016 RepID=UPI003D0B3B16